MENGGGCGGDVASLLLLTKIFTPYVGTTMARNGYIASILLTCFSSLYILIRDKLSKIWLLSDSV